MLRLLVTGSSNGIGEACVHYFLENAPFCEITGFDTVEPPEDLKNDARFHHFNIDVSKPETFPDLKFDIIVNNAGIQDNTEHCVDVNLKGIVNIGERYALHEGFKSIVNVGSVSAHTGEEFPWYAASKGGILPYTKNLAYRLAQYGATCNCISPGGVLTDLNKPVIEDKELWNDIMKVTPLKRWATAEEIAEWIWFLLVQNKSMTGQDIIIDNGEMINSKFVWTDDK